MNDTERRLAELMRTATPPPPSEISLATLQAARVAQLPTAFATPSRRPVRRWLPLIAAGAVAASIAGVVVGISLAGSSHPSGPAASVSSTPTTTIGGSSVPCLADHLSGRVLLRNSAAGHELVVIGLTNTGASACSVSGYPLVSAYGPSSVIDGLTVSDGTSQLADPGPAEVTLAPNATASFGIEASTTYNTAAQPIDALQITLPGSPTTLAVPLSPALMANGPVGQGIPLGLTAYQLAVAGATFSPSPSAPPSSITSTVPTPAGPTPSQPGSTIAPCVAGDLAIVVGRVDSGAGQRNLPVTMTNTFGPTCTVSGFPQNLTAYTSTSAASGSEVSVKASTSTGTAQTITLAKGASASFVFHSTVGYPTTPVTIVLLRFQLAGSPGQVSMEINNGGIAANGPSGQPIPVDVTALAPGTGG